MLERREGSLSARTLLLVAALTALRLAAARAADLELFGDEAQYWVWSREPAWGYYSKPPLLAWIIRATTALCGDSEFAVRLSSPLLHGATALVLAAVARHLHGERAGFWAAAFYASLPSVSLSCMLVSTDVPLLFLWSVALYAWVRLQRERSPRLVLLLAAATGAGLLAKYAMVYFWACVPLSLWAARPNRPGLARDALVAFALGVLLVVPNLVWNAGHDFVTLQHTAGNAGVGRARLRVGPALEFLGAQAGVLGPVLLIAWVAALARGRLARRPVDRGLLPFQVLPLLVVLPVAFLRRANANWAATMLPAVCVQCAGLVGAPGARRWARAAVLSSLALALLALGAAPLAAAIGRPLPWQLDPWRRVRGARALAEEVGRALDAVPGAGLLCDDRMTLARLAYELGPEREHPWSWNPRGELRHHFDLVWSVHEGAQRPYVFLTRREAQAELRSAWALVEPLRDVLVPVAAGLEERYRLLLVRGRR